MPTSRALLPLDGWPALVRGQFELIGQLRDELARAKHSVGWLEDELAKRSRYLEFLLRDQDG